MQKVNKIFICIYVNMSTDKINNSNFQLCDCDRNFCKDMCVLNENVNIALLAHVLFADKSPCEISKICQTLQMLIMLSKTYC